MGECVLRQTTDLRLSTYVIIFFLSFFSICLCDIDYYSCPHQWTAKLVLLPTAPGTKATGTQPREWHVGCLTSCGATCRPSGARPAREWSRRNVCVLPRQSWPTTPRPAPVLANHSTSRSSLGQPLYVPLQSWSTTPRAAPVLVNHSTCRSSIGQPLHVPLQFWSTIPRAVPVLVNHSTCRSSLGQPLHVPLQSWSTTPLAAWDRCSLPSACLDDVLWRLWQRASHLSGWRHTTPRSDYRVSCVLRYSRVATDGFCFVFVCLFPRFASRLGRVSTTCQRVKGAVTSDRLGVERKTSKQAWV